LGWTKAPKDEKLCCTVITTSYEVHEEGGGVGEGKEEEAAMRDSLLKDSEGEWEWEEEEPRVNRKEMKNKQHEKHKKRVILPFFRLNQPG
jgi:hypothetical protein